MTNEPKNEFVNFMEQLNDLNKKNEGIAKKAETITTVVLLGAFSFLIVVLVLAVSLRLFDFISP